MNRQEFEQRLLDILGIKRVTSFNFFVAHDTPPLVTVDFYPDDEQLDDLYELFIDIDLGNPNNVREVLQLSKEITDE